jgi:hypothetical protein
VRWVVRRRIVGFHLDEKRDWVAELECGHGQHTRHQPPWQLRPWVTTEAGRRSRIGAMLDCRKCDEGAPPDDWSVNRGVR